MYNLKVKAVKVAHPEIDLEEIVQELEDQGYRIEHVTCTPCTRDFEILYLYTFFYRERD